MKHRLFSLLLLLASAVPALFAQAVPADSVAKYTDWLYSSMNIADKHNFPRSFWERNVASALEARRDMPWGARIPAREWLHFVLPVRVNNEMPDTSRMAFYREIAPRVRNLSMEDAALEVNHWAHEKATYRPSDERTSPPLATVRTTFGRCGEESTLVVAAMRSVGIPARQIYTPRWAHTDDNHAWVEVWVDGRWRFLGACEPEPVLDLGWFNEPASQGMLMATNVIGNYDGPEQKLYRDSCYTRINITGNYARTRRASVQVVDEEGKPVANAPVSFRLYNYAELYPLFSTRTDSEGRAELLCGYGDVVAWATAPDGSSFGFARLSPSDDAPVRLALSRRPLAEPVELTLTPPKPSPLKPEVTPAQIAANDARKLKEDSIRNATMAGFFTPAEATAMAADWGGDAPFIARVLTESYGNRDVMERFVGAVPAGRRGEAVRWLANLSEKDWRDIEWPVMESFFINRPVAVNPRVSNESLSLWLTDFDRVVPASLRDSLAESPAVVEQWISRNIRLDNDLNPNRFCMNPVAVWNSRTADSHSRDIFFVTLCRWLGFDAKIDPVTSDVLARKSPGEDFTKAFATVSAPSRTVRVKLSYPGDGTLPNPKYYRHFTLSRIENGEPQLLNYPEDADWRETFAKGVDLAPGRYLLTSGRRMADGSVKARLEEFTVPETVTEVTAQNQVASTAEDQDASTAQNQVASTAECGDAEVTVPLVIPDEPGQISVIGSFNADPLLPLTGRGVFLAAFVRNNHEPSAHFLNELCSNKSQIEIWGRPVVLIVSSEADAAALRARIAPPVDGSTPASTSNGATTSLSPNLLPSNVRVAVTPGLPWLADLSAEFETPLTADNLPVVLIADTFNRVMYLTRGYRPGTVDTLLPLLPHLPR